MEGQVTAMYTHGCAPRSRANTRGDVAGLGSFSSTDVTRAAALSPDLRASDDDRATTVRQLSEHTAAGRLTLEEFEKRAGVAYAAQRLGELAPLLTDLPVSAQPARGDAARAQGDRQPWLIWLLVGLLCVTIWGLASIGQAHVLYFWPFWVIGPWGLSMLLRGRGRSRSWGRPGGPTG